MQEQEIIAACKREMWKRFPKDRVVIGRPTSTSQYGKPYTVYSYVWTRQQVEDMEDSLLVICAGEAAAWMATLHDQGTVLVVRRPWTWDCDDNMCRLSFRAHAANEIMLYTPDYAEPETGYMDMMRKALA